MSIYVTTSSDTIEDLDLPILECGAEAEHEALAVFTSEKKAQEFIEDSGWDGEAVAELSRLGAAKLLVIAQENEIDFLAIDPRSSSDSDTEPQFVLPISKPIAAHTEVLNRISEREVMS